MAGFTTHHLLGSSLYFAAAVHTTTVLVDECIFMRVQLYVYMIYGQQCYQDIPRGGRRAHVVCMFTRDYHDGAGDDILSARESSTDSSQQFSSALYFTV